jgi:hypothetical protein
LVGQKIVIQLAIMCSRALDIGARSYSSVNSILKNNLDRRRPARPADGPAITHDNIRGPTYFPCFTATVEGAGKAQANAPGSGDEHIGPGLPRPVSASSQPLAGPAHLEVPCVSRILISVSLAPGQDGPSQSEARFAAQKHPSATHTAAFGESSVKLDEQWNLSSANQASPKGTSR